MATVILVTGGSRSGKSAYAQQLAERLPGRRAFIATCPVLDDELHRRVEKHKEARRAARWDTIEETIELARALSDATDHQVLLVDCLTLWVNNLLYEAERHGGELSESDVEAHCARLLDACRQREGTIIFVTNEVGWGIVPDNALARRFRDLAGRCNQRIAAAADEVVLVVCGIPLQLKKGQARGEPA